MHIRKCILDRTVNELSTIMFACSNAIHEIEAEHPEAAVETLDGLSAKLENAKSRLLVLHDAERDASLSAYLIKPAKPSITLPKQI